jgi:peptide/nickel transport system substrate-binding protein
MRGKFRDTVAVTLACLIATPVFADKKNNSIRYADEQVLENIEPYSNNLRIGIILAQQVWDTLIYRDPVSGEYKGQLATSWKWVDDRTLEIELRHGVKFHDNSEFDADDVVYTLNFVSKPDNKVVNQQNVNWIDRAEKIDPFKVRIFAKHPFPAAIEYLAGPIVIHPHRYFAQVGPKGMNERPIGSGPYRVAEHQIGKLIRLQRNADYFKDSPRPQPKVDTIEIRFIPDPQTKLAEILSGGLDFIRNVPFDQAQQLKSVARLRVAFGETMRFAFLQLNSTERTPAPPLRNPLVRAAIFHAIDRETMVKTIVGEGSRVLHTMCFPSQFGCTDEGARRYGYDPARARQLLAQAGYPNGFQIDLYAFRDRNQTEALIGNLSAVGIKANLHYRQYAAMREAIRAGKAPLVQQSWGSFSINDVSASTPVFFKFTADDVNRDDVVREQLERGDSSVDPDARKTAYANALKLIQERAYALPLYSTPIYYVADKDLQFTAHTDEVLRFWEMSWK